MDEEMADMAEGFDPSEVDLDYEFDAPQFFDFGRLESISETEVAEGWFQSAGSYPPSPFVVKLNWSPDIPVVEATGRSNYEAVLNMNLTGDNVDIGIDPEVSTKEIKNKGKNYHPNTAQDIMRAKTKSLSKASIPKSSTLMKPTASHLAKQNKARNAHPNQFFRSQKPPTKVDEKEIDATKRQKLESGYLRKVAHLKHQTLLLHKLSKKSGPINTISIHSRGKVTIPREPDLETAQRAHFRSFRSKNVSEKGQQAKQNSHSFKARPLNRKILEAPSLPFPRKSKPQLPEFQMFHLKTMERAMQHSSASVLNAHYTQSVISSEDTDFKGSKFEGVLKQANCEALQKLKACSSSRKATLTLNEELKGLTDKSLTENPPIELFNKLSLKSEFETNTILLSKTHLKGTKENAPCSFQPEILWCAGKPYKCWSDKRIPEVACKPNMNRSLGIR